MPNHMPTPHEVFRAVSYFPPLYRSAALGRAYKWAWEARKAERDPKRRTAWRDLCQELQGARRYCNVTTVPL